MTALDLEARPTWMTPRTPSRATRGPEVVRVMRRLGFDPHPWQREALDVAYEVDDDGRLVYGECIWLLPRRSGKTVIGLSTIVHRGHAFDDHQRSLSNMQSGIDSRAMFRDTWLPILERSPFAGTYKPIHQISHEQIRWHHGPVHSVRSPGPKAGVGADLDLWLNDECWALPTDEMEGAILPTMATRSDAQVHHMSMAGTEESRFLIGKRDLGRELVDAGIREGTFYLEFSAPPDADPLDERLWHRHHPAVGRTITVERLRRFAQSMPLAEFAQHFLGIWRDVARPPAIIDADAWAAHLEKAPRSKAARLVDVHLVVDCAPDATRSSVAAAGTRTDGRRQVDVIRNDDGTSWVADVVEELVARHRPASVAVNDIGPASTLAPDLERRLRRHRVDLVRLNYGDAARAAGAFIQAFTEGDARHLGQPALDAALAGAAKKVRGDLFTFARVGAADITPLISAALALWQATRTEAKATPEWSIL